MRNGLFGMEYHFLTCGAATDRSIWKNEYSVMPTDTRNITDPVLGLTSA